MRKWMRDRLTRRKKTPAEPTDQPAPPPLQPAYFDAEQQPGPAPETGNIEPEIQPTPLKESRPVRRPRSAPQEEQLQDQPSETQPTPTPSVTPASGSTGRGRRRRGGRGRGGRGREQAVAQAFTPAAVKGSIPVIPVDAADEDLANAG